MAIVSEKKKNHCFNSTQILSKKKPNQTNERAYPCSLGPSVPDSTQVVQIPSYSDADIPEKKVRVF